MCLKEDEKRGYSYQVHLHQKLVIEQGAVCSQKLGRVVGGGRGERRGHVRGQQGSKQLGGGRVSLSGVFGGGERVREGGIGGKGEGGGGGMCRAARPLRHGAHTLRNHQNTKAVGNEGPRGPRVVLFYYTFGVFFFRRGFFTIFQKDRSGTRCPVSFSNMYNRYSVQIMNPGTPVKRLFFVPVPTVMHPASYRAFSHRASAPNSRPHMRCIAFVLHLSALAGPGCVLQGNQQLAACFIDITDNCHSWLPNGQVTGAPPPPQSHMQQLLMYATIILQV
jgi:hypothetical protein